MRSAEGRHAVPAAGVAHDMAQHALCALNLMDANDQDGAELILRRCAGDAGKPVLALLRAGAVADARARLRGMLA
jgi:hypothetical protein